MYSKKIEPTLLKKILLDHLRGCELKELAQNYSINREKIRQNLINRYPYLYKNKKNPRMLKMLLTVRADGYFEKLIGGKWYIFDKKFQVLINCLPLRDNGNGYLHGTYKRKTYYIHRILVCAKKGQEVDHIDRDKSNNTIENLRLATRSQNAANRLLFNIHKVTERKLKKTIQGLSQWGLYWLFRE